MIKPQNSAVFGILARSRTYVYPVLVDWDLDGDLDLALLLVFQL